MTKLIIDERRCRIDGEDDTGLLWALDKHLSFNIQGAQFSRAYKHGYMDQFTGNYVSWDGKTKLLEESNLSFPIGLKQRVLEFYESNGSTLEIIDNRPSPSYGTSIDIFSTLVKMGKTPRPYQISALNATRNHDCGIIRAGTGAGKTLISALITADIGKKTLILVVGKDLLYQFKKYYESIFDEEIGIIGDGHFEIKDITIATIWSVGTALGLSGDAIVSDDFSDQEKALDSSKYEKIKDFLSSVKLVMLDECHMAACATIQELNKHINPEHIYGLSASPWRDDGADLLIEAILGSKIVEISSTSLIKEGYLVKPIIKFVRVPEYHHRLKKNYQSIYKTYMVDNEVRNNLVVSNTENLVNLGYRPLVLYNSVRHGNILHEMISKKVPCALLSGKDKMEVREKAKEDIESGKIKTIIASKIFDQGVDVPVLSGLVVAGGGKSSVRALQRIGRVIRPYPGKKQAAVVDFIDQAHYVKKHSQARKEIYASEEGFDIRWPKN